MHCGKFFCDLADFTLSSMDIVEKHLLSGTPYVFEDNNDIYFDLRKELSIFFNVSNFNNILMVGSAKMGFSMNPHNCFRGIQDDSDIDMVIMDEGLFDVYWKKLFEFNLDYNINLIPRSEKEEGQYKRFLEYFFKGWIRPDYFPFKYDGRKKWFDFFKKISYSKYDKRKVTGAIFKNEYFFKKYHASNIESIRRVHYGWQRNSN